MKYYSANDLLEIKKKELAKKGKGIPIIFKEYNTQSKLASSISIPSTTHAYSIGVQYMRDWILDKFNKDYFKTVFINGRHIMDDYMKLSSYSMIKREKPAVAFTPLPNLDHDRELVDSYMGNTEMLIKKFNHEQCFFRDYENNVFLGLGVREQEIQFNIRFRVETRAQQLDLLRKIEMKCRIGYTHKEFISADFHIPYELMVNIAKSSGFEVDKDDNIIDIVSFLRYLNSHSSMPVTYKLRLVNGNREFFIRPDNVYVHIDTRDKLSYDDGEREGQVDNNFNIEMVATLRMWVPSYYVYTSAKPIYKVIPTLDSAQCIVSTFKAESIPETNDNGWGKYFVTDYELDDDEIKNNEANIDLSQLFANVKVKFAIQDHINMNLSPSRFIDIKIFEYSGNVVTSIDWNTLMMKVTNTNPSSNLKIVIYIDQLYYNEHVSTMNQINKTRLK